MELEFNPWDVPNLEVFNFYFCPECDTKHETKSLFVGHALELHPKARLCIPMTELTQDPTFVMPDVKPICADEGLIISDQNELICDSKDFIVEKKAEVMCDICYSMVDSIDDLKSHIEMNHEVKIQEFDIATVPENVDLTK